MSATRSFTSTGALQKPRLPPSPCRAGVVLPCRRPSISPLAVKYTLPVISSFCTSSKEEPTGMTEAPAPLSTLSFKTKVQARLVHEQSVELKCVERLWLLLCCCCPRGG
eukprot:171647-Amphidinium_carterae.1